MSMNEMLRRLELLGSARAIIRALGDTDADFAESAKGICDKLSTEADRLMAAALAERRELEVIHAMTESLKSKWEEEDALKEKGT